jgi:hypothetical protein
MILVSNTSARSADAKDLKRSQKGIYDNRPRDDSRTTYMTAEPTKTAKGHIS